MLPHSVRLTLDRYGNLIDLHTEQLNDPLNTPDLKTMQFERASVFADLKNQLTCLIKNSKNGKDGSKEAEKACWKGIGIILEKDALLKRKLADYRCGLQDKRRMVNQGKTALHGYGGSGLSNNMRRGFVYQR